MLGPCLRAHILKYIYEAKELTRKVVDIWNFTAHLQWHTSSKKATPPNPSLTIPLTWEQAFKYRNLWGPFSFNPPQKLISSGDSCFLSTANVSHLPRKKYHGSLNCLDLRSLWLGGAGPVFYCHLPCMGLKRSISRPVACLCLCPLNLSSFCIYLAMARNRTNNTLLPAITGVSLQQLLLYVF